MNKEFNKGLFLAGFGSFWWGFFGVLYFKYITFIGHTELVVHRCLWTTFTLVITTFFFSKWNIFFSIIKASAVLKIDPILFKLLMSSRIIIRGVFGLFLNLITSILPSSLFFNFLIYYLTMFFYKVKD